jgi:hypothetical protein
MFTRTGIYRSLIVVASALSGIGLIALGGVSTSPRTVEPHNFSKLGIVAVPPSMSIYSEHPETPETVAFEIRNVGGRDVRIIKMATSCGCTLAEPLSSDELKPGTSQWIKFTATAPAFGSRPVTIDVFLAADDERETLPLLLNLNGRSEVSEHVVEFPQTLELTHSEAISMEREFYVVTLEEASEPPLLGTIKPQDSHIRLDLIDIDDRLAHASGKTNRVYHYRAVVQIPEEAGDWHASTIQLASSRSSGRQLPAIRILARRHSEWLAVPSLLYLRSGDDESMEQEIIIQAVDPTDTASVERLQIASAPSDIKSRWVANERAGERRLAVQAVESAGVSQIDSDEFVLRDNETGNTLRIPVVWGESVSSK